jgi:very-short-patch-repair endonuclease
MGYRVLRITWEEVMFGWEEVEQQILAIVRRGDHRWPRNRPGTGRGGARVAG